MEDIQKVKHSKFQYNFIAFQCEVTVEDAGLHQYAEIGLTSI